MIKKVITREKFKAYVAVQMSGVTNMWDVAKVMSLSGLAQDECMDIMKNYGKYREQFKEEGNLDDKGREQKADTRAV